MQPAAPQATLPSLPFAERTFSQLELASQVRRCCIYSKCQTLQALPLPPLQFAEHTSSHIILQAGPLSLPFAERTFSQLDLVSQVSQPCYCYSICASQSRSAAAY